MLFGVAGGLLCLSSAGSASAQISPAPERSERQAVSSASQSPPLRVQVIDGTSFQDVETKHIYRLYGIDACAPTQIAYLGRQPWPCGAMATAWLVTATLGKWVACNTIGQVDDANLARCAAPGHSDLAASMLREGMAVTVRSTPDQPIVKSYAAIEQAARKSFRGLWASRFEMPWEFRRADRKQVTANQMPVE